MIAQNQTRSGPNAKENPIEKLKNWWYNAERDQIYFKKIPKKYFLKASTA